MTSQEPSSSNSLQNARTAIFCFSTWAGEELEIVKCTRVIMSTSQNDRSTGVIRTIYSHKYLNVDCGRSEDDLKKTIVTSVSPKLSEYLENHVESAKISFQFRCVTTPVARPCFLRGKAELSKRYNT